MAVFEYRGLIAATGKQVRAFATPTTPKALRAALKREGVLLTSANEDKKAPSAKGKEGSISARCSAASRRRTSR